MTDDGDPLTGDPASPDVRRLIAMLHPGEVLRPEWSDVVPLECPVCTALYASKAARDSCCLYD